MLTLFASGAVFGPMPAVAAPPDAMTEVKATVDQVLQTLQNPEYKSAPSERRQKLREVIGGHFDFAAMARSALGVRWKTLSEQQRQEFVPLFTHLMEAVYMSRIEGGYSGQKVQYVREFSEGTGYSQVNTNVTQTGGAQPISVNYRLKREGDDWKVYDVLIDGISLVGNYRNQFSRVINSKGYDALVAEIRQKASQAGAARGG